MDRAAIAALEARLGMPANDPLEPQCVKLVEALNRLPGITTTASCGCCSGDPEAPDPYYVALETDTVSALLPIATVLRRPSLSGWVFAVIAWAGLTPPLRVRFSLRYWPDPDMPTQARQAEAQRESEKLAKHIRRAARQLGGSGQPGASD